MKVPGKAEPQFGTPRYYLPGYLPHFDSKEKIQSITFRLADSHSQEKLKEVDERLKLFPENQQVLSRRKKIEPWLDSGIGYCALRNPDVARVVQDTLLKFDGSRFRFHAWCIMPNRVHVVIEPNERLGKIE